MAAALLQQQGFKVEGVTMKLTAGLCCDIGSAQAVCHHLGIPHRLIDAQAEFSRNIINDFVAEYRQGRTPNPCIKCNDLVKFPLLLDVARVNGFDFLATGHYARIEQDHPRFRAVLKKGVDEHKDQSYFLYRLTQDQLKNVLFPLGTMLKTDVRSLASTLNLPAAERPESQEICFVPDNDYRSFLKEFAPDTLRPGEIVLSDGSVVGRHEGIAFFTIGQRRHLGVAAAERLYVVRIDQDRNRVVLGRSVDLQTKEMMVSNTSFILPDDLRLPMKVTVKIRYRSPVIPATIESADFEKVKVVFTQPARGVCPGQAAVFYEAETVVGGGAIV
jgi:tRNA-uridine 2-sulfurtransferase